MYFKDFLSTNDVVQLKPSFSSKMTFQKSVKH